MEKLSLYGKTKSYGNVMLYLGTLYNYVDLLHMIAINFLYNYVDLLHMIAINFPSDNR